MFHCASAISFVRNIIPFAGLVTGVKLDGLEICNAVEPLENGEAGFQNFVCETCGYAECEHGAWFCLRRISDLAVFLPAAAKLRDGTVRADAYGAMQFVRDGDAVAMDQTMYEEMSERTKTFPDWSGLPELGSLDVLVFRQLAAEGSFLGDASGPARVREDLALAVTDGELEEELATLGDLLTRIEQGEAVDLIETPDRIVEFHLDLPDLPTWTGLAYREGRPGLLFARI